ncbi:hypothetical protein WA158_001630 [Blastocystis sp. Blastoise]
MATNQLQSLSKLLNLPINGHQDELYLIRLASLSLKELQEEPNYLQDQHLSLESELKKDLYEKNDVFVDSQQCFTNLTKNIQILSKDVSDSYNILPSLQYTCKKFTDEAEDLVKQHQKNKKTLRYHTQLLELLEMPQLMDTCVKNGLHDEALILLSQSRKLTSIHKIKENEGENASKDPGQGAAHLLYKIWTEMEQVACNQKIILWEELEGELLLQRAMTVVRLLTKISECLRPFNAEEYPKYMLNEERTIRQQFLLARTEYFNKKLSIYSKFDSGLFLKEYIDLCRELWLNTLTQYISIFMTNDASSISSPIDAVSIIESNTPSSPSSLESPMETVSENSLERIVPSTCDIAYDAHEWFLIQIDTFVETLNMYMFKITSGTVMLQVMKQGLYLCDSISSIHCDFRGILIHFSDSLSSPSFWSKPIYTTNLYRLKDPYTFNKYYLNSADYFNMIPPDYLMEIPILAKLFNDFLSSFNELRYCAIKGQGPNICSSITGHCITICSSFVNCQQMLKTILVPRSSSEGVISIQDHYSIIVIQFYATILPLINIYLQKLFHTQYTFVDIDKITSFLVENNIYTPPPSFSPLRAPTPIPDISASMAIDDSIYTEINSTSQEGQENHGNQNDSKENISSEPQGIKNEIISKDIEPGQSLPLKTADNSDTTNNVSIESSSDQNTSINTI